MIRFYFNPDTTTHEVVRKTLRDIILDLSKNIDKSEDEDIDANLIDIFWGESVSSKNRKWTVRESFKAKEKYRKGTLHCKFFVEVKIKDNPQLETLLALKYKIE